MIMIGPRGTGKSTLLKVLTKTFESHNSGHILAKTMSGVTATVIGGVVYLLLVYQTATGWTEKVK